MINIKSNQLNNNTVFILDKRKDDKDDKDDLLYLFDKYDDKIITMINMYAITFINKYDANTNVSIVTYWFGKKFFRFFPEHLTNFIPLNYFKKTLETVEWINKLFTHKYKHSFNIQSTLKMINYF